MSRGRTSNIRKEISSEGNQSKRGNYKKTQTLRWKMFKECKGCCERRFNCHSWCEKYLKFRQKQLTQYKQNKLRIDCGINGDAYSQTNDRRTERK
jgi:hypothetical protein